MADSEGDESDFASAESEQEDNVVGGEGGGGGDGEREGGGGGEEGGREGGGKERGGGGEEAKSEKQEQTSKQVVGEETRETKEEKEEKKEKEEEKEREEEEETKQDQGNDQNTQNSETGTESKQLLENTNLKKETDKSEVKVSPMLEDGSEKKAAASVEIEEVKTVAKTELSSTAVGDGGDGGGGGGGGGWGWGGWGKSLWSSVSTVTESAQVLSQKVTSAITTVEDALGVPSPRQLASEGGDEEEKEKEEEKEEDEKKDVATLASLAENVLDSDSTNRPDPKLTGPNVEPESDREGESVTGGFSTFFSGIATVVEQRGLQLMTGGLDALENIGKKTIEVLTEGDPGFQKKRRFLKGEAPSLSALLREAKAESEAKQNKADGGSQRGQTQQGYSALFDEYQGVIHLEALELLSNEYAGKVRGCLPSLSGEEEEWAEEQMELVAQTLSVQEDGDGGLAVLDDDSGKLEEIQELFSDMTPAIKVEKLVQVSKFWREKLKDLSSCINEESKEPEGEQGQEEVAVEEDTETKKRDMAVETQKEGDKKPKKEVVYDNGLRGLVQLTSASIELFRKIAEVSLLPQATKVDTIGQAKKFNRLTVLISSELDALASVHAEVLTELGTDDVNSTITTLYMESSNSVSYVQDSLQLLRPVLQYIVLQEIALHQPSRNVHSRS